MWQVLRQQWVGRGVEIVAVAEDVAGAAEAEPLADWAGSQHPSLIDQDLVLARTFGILDVPSSVWIDEEGVIVRPAEPAPLNARYLGDVARRAARADYHAPPGRVSKVGGRAFIDGQEDSQLWQEMLEEMAVGADRPAGPTYTERLVDWFERGSDSIYVVGPDELPSRAGPRPLAHSEAAAHFEIGCHLYALGDDAGSVEHWSAAHRLHPESLTYKRQAWTLAAGPMQGPSEQYDGYWLAEMRARRARNEPEPEGL